MRALFLVLAMAACAPKMAPPEPLYRVAPPPPAPPELPELPSVPQSCRDAGYRIGQPPPHLDAQGNATCVGLVLGVDAVAELERDSGVELPWFRSQLATCTSARELDRSACDVAVQGLRLELDATRRELRVVRRVLPWVAVAAAVVGAGFTVAVLAAQRPIVAP